MPSKNQALYKYNNSSYKVVLGWNSYHETITYPSFKLFTMHTPTHLYKLKNQHLLLQNKKLLSMHHLCLIWKMFTAYFVNKAMPIHAWYIMISTINIDWKFVALVYNGEYSLISCCFMMSGVCYSIGMLKWVIGNTSNIVSSLSRFLPICEGTWRPSRVTSHY